MLLKIRKTTHTVMFNTKNLPAVVIYLLFTFLFSSSVFSEARYIYRIPWHGEGKWLIGDTHMHTIHSDGYYTVDEVAEKSFQYGCDFIAFTNHDVSIPQDKLDSARLKYPSMLIFQGTEWTMPAGEHCCIIVPKHPGETAYINEFLSNFSWRSAPHKPDTDADSQAGFIWLDTHTISGLKPVAIINHPNRENIYSYAKLYNYFLMGDALIGFSGAPGAQNRDPYYNTIDGWDIIYAQVGNMVDRLLNNGIKVTAARAPSDFHGDKDERWPGEYSRTHIYVKDKTYDSIIEGFRAGAAFADHDNICNKIEFTMNTGKLTDIIPGEIVLVDKGDDVNVSIKIQPNSSVVFDEIQFISNKNNVPRVSKIFKSNNDIETIIPFDAVWKYAFPEK
ncbi:hypothetical protein KAS50_08075, partial [bacterium]|nr:hypothetical protein [bacterium]